MTAILIAFIVGATLVSVGLMKNGSTSDVTKLWAMVSVLVITSMTLQFIGS